LTIGSFDELYHYITSESNSLQQVS
jgi:hypothetical protein